MNPISQASSRIFPLSQQEPLSPLNPMPVSQGTPATGAVGTFESVLGQVLAPVSVRTPPPSFVTAPEPLRTPE